MSKVDLLLVNPPSPDSGIWIRTQHRTGRRSRENMIWPQVSLAQLAAMLVPDYTVDVIDAIALRLSWKDFELLLKDRQPTYYLTQVASPTLTNDMYGVFLAKAQGALTMGFGTHVTPMAFETLNNYPALDFVLRGEPEMTLRELIDTFEVTRGRWKVDENGNLVHGVTRDIATGNSQVWKAWRRSDPEWQPAWTFPYDPMEEEGSASGCQRNKVIIPIEARRFPMPTPANSRLGAIKGLGWRRDGKILINPDRPFIRDLDDLPIPLHHLLPLSRYRSPLIKGSYSFVVTSRGCPAGCKFCIKHAIYQDSVRLRSAENILKEIMVLCDLGIYNIHSMPIYSPFIANR
jgi:anaerobic magnesium-protoporphyrin IX monomethyl ester cyclase